ncbi:XRE family transcriptional regulator [Ktedonosporobacter rubrisoli]|uniref:XRE family transcriptional regulator n=1 Tax=Ktedonosporobacter rubrisoli TaxID=2509675 RepID=A0A4V0YY50_KTERU|nr:helix-turn-helix transcriptional regulator [Ktedonosporobacter rubrisoli]QBD74991.1 XRE family transcriptional regulator [Ktedonosporobacter rubrisoli]
MDERLVRRRLELADFLKTRRARLSPEQFGLPAFPRRRVHGLRREEVALLVGVGVSWYTWLEQGRDIHVSDQFLERLAQVLQLAKEERCHLFALARETTQVGATEEEMPPANSAYRAVLDGLSTYPAQVLDRRLNVVAWNESARRVFGDFPSFSERERNTTWFAFMHPSPRKLLVHWERTARQSMALLRARSDQHIDEEWFQSLIADLLRASPEFRAWWPEHEVSWTCQGLGELKHPRVGHLTLQPTFLCEPSRPDWQIVIHTPFAQDETEARLAALMR